ncbi:oxidoreductase [Spelaeicoccus albus]|uniref:Uncharacterized protein n=1 Tax=Spelaeicoccus albus TaxID=1280376 RepID=A0A7Z0D3R6_9MICO|nr:oxidoreductase [Spelaeicoccus albus]NYI68334.1 hypothetical protein [Spelaeicoccus albus]
MSRLARRLRGLMRRKKAPDLSTGNAAPNPRQAAKERREATVSYVRDFIRTRVGVEAYIEPATAATSATLLLIATTGEWTRRAVPSEEAGWMLARDMEIPVYDVLKTGYPPRMRAWTRRRRGEARRRPGGR